MNKRYIIGAIVAALAVVAVLVGVSLAGGDSTEVSTIEGVADVEKELGGITQAGNVLGMASAPVTIVEYGDLACPACKSAADTLIPELIADYVRPGKAKLEFRAIAFISPSSERGALGLEAAGLQDRMWSLLSLLYRNQGDERDDWLSDDLLEQAAEKAGVDVDRWRTDYEGDAVASAFFQRAEAANADGVNATPTFVVSGPRGSQKVSSDEVVGAIAAVGPATS